MNVWTCVVASIAAPSATPWRGLVLAGTLALQGCGMHSQADLLALARQEIQAKDYATAVVRLKELLQHDDKLAEARLLLGKALLETGDAAGAVSELRRAQQGDQPPEVVVPLLARALLLSGQTRSLIAQFAGTDLQQASAAADLDTSLATAYGALGNRDAEEHALQAALKAQPDFAPAELLRARTLSAQGQVDQALAIVQQVNKADPGRAEAWVLRGDLLRTAKSDEAGATQAYESAIKADPRAVAAHSALIELAMTTGKPALGRSRLADMVKAAPGQPLTLYNEARMALLDKDMKTARAKLQQALHILPNDVRFLLLAGEVEGYAGAPMQAESFLAKAVTLAPHASGPRLELADLQIRLADGAGALTTVAPMLAAAVPPPRALTIGAQAHMLLGELPQAEALLVRASLADPHNDRTRAALAVARLAHGDSARSAGELEAIAAKDPDWFADHALMTARLQNHDLPGALKALEGAEKKQPRNPVPVMLRARLQLRYRDQAGARASFERVLQMAPGYLPAVLSLADLDLKSGQPKSALARVNSVLAADPSNMRARLALADLQRLAGAKPEEVQATIEQAVQDNPGDPEPLLALVQHHLARNDASPALAAAERALTAFPDDIRVLAAVGEAQSAAGQFRQAIGSLRKVSGAEPKNALALLRLGEAYHAANDDVGARQAFQAVIALAPNDLPAHRGLIALAMRNKSWSVALEDARQVQRLAPQRPEGWRWEGGVYEAQQQWGKALAAYRTAQGKAPTSDVAVALHAALLAAGQAADADRYAAEWQGGHPADAGFLLHLGEVAATRGDFAAAEFEDRAALAASPDNVVALNNLAWAMTKQGKPGAAAIAQRADQLAPNRATILNTWAVALAAENQAAKALTVQTRAVALAPDDPQQRLDLARIALKAAARDVAMTELTKLAALGAKLPEQDEVARLMKAAQ
jgi:putative PEP-CTERM system TPR-repeat lipoprotein